MPIPNNLGSNRQLEIYTGARSSVPIEPAALERKARGALDPAAWDYVMGSAGGERTAQANLAAFDRWPIVPRMQRDVGERCLAIDLLGARLPAPLLLGPVGVQSIIHKEAELPAAHAAASLHVPFVLSTVSSRSMEQVAAVMGNAPRWFQLYPAKDPALNASFIRRAEAAGYSAILVTLDTRILGWRPRDLDRAFLPFLQGEGFANYFTDPVFRASLAAPPENDPATAIRHCVGLFGNPSSTWDDMRALRDRTRLPLLLKGILHPDDARRALDCGADGVIVSNHGGRQVDGAIAALDALPPVVEALGGRIPALFDSGIRRGSDILKALALGAAAVLIGRPFCLGLAAAGEAGVRDVILNLLAEFDLALALSGYSGCGQLDRSALGLAQAAHP